MEMDIKQFNTKNHLLNKKLLLAISGGVDSMVLLDLYKKEGSQISVAHLNHNLRPESAKEQTYLNEYCHKENIPFYTKTLKTKPSSEEAARNARYTFLKNIKERSGCDFILTAHHLNDQAETLILKLTRGSGPLDLWGMNEIEGDVARPLLGLKKSELMSYAQRNKLKYFEDQTNKDLNFSRNRIRHKVIPELEKINPNFLENLKNTIKLGHEESQLVKNHINKIKSKVILEKSLNLQELDNVKTDFIKGEVLRGFLEQLTGSKKNIYRKNLEELNKIIKTKGTKRTSLLGITLTKEYNFLSLKKPTPSKKKAVLKVGEETKFNDFRLILKQKVEISSKNHILLPASLAYNLNIRTWEAGDRIKTKSGTKKLQDLFTDAKISQDDRKKWPIVISRDEIIWVPLLAKNKGHLQNATKESFNLEVIDERKKH